MPLVDYQRTYRGYAFGAGSDINIVEEHGVEGLDVVEGDRPQPRGHGQIPGQHYADSKVVTLTLEVAGTAEDAEPVMSTLLDVFQVVVDQEHFHTYVVQNPGQPTRFLRCRPIQVVRSRVDTDDAVRELRVALKAADPRLYSEFTDTVAVGIFEAAGGGFNIPIVQFPINMTAATQQTGVANNDGNTFAYPVVTFSFPTGGAGTCTGVRLTNLSNGDVLDITATLTAGQTLIADMDAYIRATGGHVIYITPDSSRYGDWEHPREPFRLMPGDNTLMFEVTGTSLVVECAVTWFDTWI